MKLLLDTHILIWLLEGSHSLWSEKLSRLSYARAIENDAATIFKQDKQIAEAEVEIARLQLKIKSLEENISSNYLLSTSIAKIGKLNDIFERILDGTHTNADRETLRQLLDNSDRETILQLGKYNINIADGKDIHIGDRIYQQWDDRAIRALIKAIQKINWRCVASLTENDYTQGKIQSTGISAIDKLAKRLTDFSQQSVMLYGLKLAFSPQHWRGVTSIAISPNGDTLISGGRDQTIKVWRQPD